MVSPGFNPLTVIRGINPLGLLSSSQATKLKLEQVPL